MTDEPVTRDLIGRVVDFHRAHDSPGAVIQIAPSVLPPDWQEICAVYGLTPDSYFVKLVCEVEDFCAGHSELHVAPVGPERALEWVSVTCGPRSRTRSSAARASGSWPPSRSWTGPVEIRCGPPGRR
ncbi:hypothetical protein [Nonomuraea sp. NPDC049480]|uniref:hypothetical protein n=1 Tax=Nonomuraea sp. NPDC049480 TaxID=3364353 RepID=UPI0037B8ADF7